MSETDAVKPKYALRPTEVWDDYEQTIADDPVEGFCSTYWCDSRFVSPPTSRFTAEYLSYHIKSDPVRPGAIFSGVLWPMSEKYREPEGMVYDELVAAARAAQNERLLSYWEGAVRGVEDLHADGEAEAVCVREAGCMGYFEETLTIMERWGPVVIRTSVKPQGLDPELIPPFVHGFHAVVRQRVSGTFDELAV